LTRRGGERIIAENRTLADTMRRRKLLIALGAGMLAAPYAGLAQQQRVYRIGYLANQPDPRATSSSFKAFVDALREQGWIEGKNIEIRIRSARGRNEKFPELAAELVRENVDIIVTTGAASTQAAKAATDRIPIVFGSTANPVEQEFVGSLARPGGNLTGSAILVQELGPKRLQLLKELLPHVSRVGRLYPSLSLVDMQPAITLEYDNAARTLGIVLRHIKVAAAEDIEPAMATAARNRVEAVIMDADALFVVNRQRIVDLALKHRLPLMGPDGRYAEAGALVSYGENFAILYRRAGFLVDKILRGAKPADIPIERPMTFELMLNLKTADALGVAVPTPVLVRADRTFK
jgi:putative ABC transport system substrate-binding protein